MIAHLEAASSKMMITTGIISLNTKYKNHKSSVHKFAEELVKKTTDKMMTALYWSIAYNNYNCFGKKEDSKQTKFPLDGFEATLKVQNGNKEKDWLMIKKVTSQVLAMVYLQDYHSSNVTSLVDSLVNCIH